MAIQTVSLMDILPTLLIFTFGSVIYLGYVFIFYKFISSNDVFDLNLHKYAEGSHPLLKTIFGISLWTVEFTLIFPLMAFFWSIAYAVMLAFMTENMTMLEILLVSVSMVASVRIVSYFSEEAADILAQTVPLTILAIFYIDIHFVKFDQVMILLTSLQDLIVVMAYCLVFIAIIEFVMRITQKIVKRRE